MSAIPVLPDFPASISDGLAQPGAALWVGMDLVLISRIQETVDKLGDRFMRRIFTEQEAAYARSTPVLLAERLAARFAAKEAALKALRMADKGIAWQDMEVLRHSDGRCDLQLHGKAAAHASQMGVTQMSLSLSHDGAYAAAIVAVVRQPPLQ
jgi:holo-[acyl-carrier protein] synthase